MNENTQALEPSTEASGKNTKPMRAYANPVNVANTFSTTPVRTVPLLSSKLLSSGTNAHRFSPKCNKFRCNIGYQVSRLSSKLVKSRELSASDSFIVGKATLAKNKMTMNSANPDVNAGGTVLNTLKRVSNGLRLDKDDIIFFYFILQSKQGEGRGGDEKAQISRNPNSICGFSVVVVAGVLLLLLLLAFGVWLVIWLVKDFRHIIYWFKKKKKKI